jgi:Uma2 family endonuclease
MATVVSPLVASSNGYPTSDGKPMAETDHHRIQMTDAIETLDEHFASEPMVYVSGNLLLFLEEGNKRRHISPDVFVVRGVPKRLRLNYLLWEEGRGPDVVIEITSSSTRREDQGDKRETYRDVLKVREYFLFDPFGDYLDPPLQGYRLRGGRYQKIRPRQGRLPSQALGLHLERQGQRLRLWSPATQTWLLTPKEGKKRAERRAEEEARLREQAERRAEEEARLAAEETRRRERAEAEVDRLLAELNRLRELSQQQP